MLIILVLTGASCKIITNITMGFIKILIETTIDEYAYLYNIYIQFYSQTCDPVVK